MTERHEVTRGSYCPALRDLRYASAVEKGNQTVHCLGGYAAVALCQTIYSECVNSARGLQWEYLTDSSRMGTDKIELVLVHVCIADLNV